MNGRYQDDLTVFRQILHHHANSGQMYTDIDFKGIQENIIDPNDEIDDLMDLGPVSWHRTRDIPALQDRSGKSYLFHDKIEPNDIIQGQLGDCYFLSSLAALAEHPQRVRNIFLNRECN